MFKLGDKVKIKPEWRGKNEPEYIYTVTNVNDKTKRCYITTTLPGWSLPVSNLVSFEMIEKVGEEQ